MAKHKFDTLGVMLDMSRNAVMRPDSLEKLLPLLKKMGYNLVMLYTEDTYEIDGEPYFGYMRGRYSKQELKDIDALARSLGMELVPCVQTLAHLNGTLRWKQIPTDCDDILLCDDEKTYEFLQRMFDTLAECFSSKRIHIGMDEAHNLGRGKHLDIHGYEPVHTIMKRHLDRILPMIHQHWDEVLIWSDMYFRPWNNGKYRIGRTQMPQEVIDSLPQGITPVYWDYYQDNQDGYSAMMENHTQLSKNTWFAGGVWCWYGFAPHNKFSLDSMLPAIRACRENNIRHMFMTMWGDNGHECSRYSQLSALHYIACYAKGIEDENLIKARFKRLIGMEFDDFMALDLANDVLPYEAAPKNPCKYMLYSDPFSGFLDYTVAPGAGKNYGVYAQRLHAIAKKSRRYGYIFETQARLCDLLEIKYELGVNTRRAYTQKDMAELKRLAVKDYTLAIHHLEKFIEAFRHQWMLENKPHGFQVHELRLGGTLLRLKSCQKRLMELVAGKIDSIPELEDEVLPFGEKERSINANNYALYSTTQVF